MPAALKKCLIKHNHSNPHDHHSLFSAAGIAEVRVRTPVQAWSFQAFLAVVYMHLKVISRNSDWLIALLAHAVIGRINYFDIGFSIAIWKPLCTTIL